MDRKHRTNEINEDGEKTSKEARKSNGKRSGTRRQSQ
jgi:hypothetical protein